MAGGTAALSEAGFAGFGGIFRIVAMGRVLFRGYFLRRLEGQCAEGQ